MLLGRAVELAGFRSLDRLLAAKVTGPLGMRETRYLPLAALSECETGRLIPTGWSEVRQREKAGEVDDENAAAMGGVAGHAGLFSTTGDLFLFAREIVRARRGEGRVLSYPSAARIATRVAQPPKPCTSGVATRLPRTHRMASSFKLKRSMPSNSTKPPVTRPGSEISRMIEKLVTLLPQPDSPTIPNVSPRWIAYETPSTALS